MKAINCINNGMLNFIVKGNIILGFGRNEKAFDDKVLHEEAYKVSDYANGSRYIYLKR